jgi:hypothetical protein
VEAYVRDLFFYEERTYPSEEKKVGTSINLGVLLSLILLLSIIYLDT